MDSGPITNKRFFSQVYIGPNLTSVHYLHQQSEAAWFYTQLPWRSKEFKFSPFEVPL